MSAADLVMMDEPSLGSAPMLVKEVFDIIAAINQQGKTVLLVEQNAFAALKIAHYAYVLEVGTIVLQGTGAELIADIVFVYGSGLKGSAHSNGMRTQGERHRGPFRGSDLNVNNSRRNVL